MEPHNGFFDPEELKTLTRIMNPVHKIIPDERIIYEPVGEAREYAPLAINTYKGCSHGCLYCYGKQRLSQEQKQLFASNANPKKHFIEKLQYKAKKMKGDEREILLSFLGDVYQPAETELRLTREAIKILIQNDLTFTILTKGGTRAIRDFDLLQDYDKARFGTTIIFLDQKLASEWEPGAPSIRNRIKAIQTAKERGIPTWVSLEPVINPEEALRVIEELHPIVDHWKVGKINHFPEIEKEVNWKRFKQEAEALLEEVKADFYIKNSLTKLKGEK